MKKTAAKANGTPVAKNDAITNKKAKIQSKHVYNVTMQEIDLLMEKGEANLTKAELKRLQTLAEAAETYEDTYNPLPVPASLPDIVK